MCMDMAAGHKVNLDEEWGLGNHYLYDHAMNTHHYSFKTPTGINFMTQLEEKKKVNPILIFLKIKIIFLNTIHNSWDHLNV